MDRVFVRGPVLALTCSLPPSPCPSCIPHLLYFPVLLAGHASADTQYRSRKMTDLENPPTAAASRDVATASSTTEGSTAHDGVLQGGALGGGSAAPASTSVTGSEPIRALETYPHLGHYILNLLQSLQGSPQRTTAAVHPLSVSSSGESDEEDAAPSTGSGDQQGGAQKTARKTLSADEKDRLVHQVVDRLDNEDEDGVKELLKPYLGDMASVSGSTLNLGLY